MNSQKVEISNYTANTYILMDSQFQSNQSFKLDYVKCNHDISILNHAIVTLKDQHLVKEFDCLKAKLELKYKEIGYNF